MKKMIIIIAMLCVMIAGCTECPYDNKYSEAWIDSYGAVWVSKGLDSMAISFENNCHILSPKPGYNTDNYGHRVYLRHLSGFNLDGINDSYCYDEDDYNN